MNRLATTAMLPAALASVVLVAGCGRNKEVTLDGSRDVVLSVTLDVEGLAAELESRVPDDKKQDPKYQQLTGQLTKLGVRRAEFYLHRDGSGDLQPVIFLLFPRARSTRPSPSTLLRKLKASTVSDLIPTSSKSNSRGRCSRPCKRSAPGSASSDKDTVTTWQVCISCTAKTERRPNRFQRISRSHVRRVRNDLATIIGRTTVTHFLSCSRWSPAAS